MVGMASNAVNGDVSGGSGWAVTKHDYGDANPHWEVLLDPEANVGDVKVYNRPKPGSGGSPPTAVKRFVVRVGYARDYANAQQCGGPNVEYTIEYGRHKVTLACVPSLYPD